MHQVTGTRDTNRGIEREWWDVIDEIGTSFRYGYQRYNHHVVALDEETFSLLKLRLRSLL